MKKQITITASLITVAMLSGCAPSQLSFLQLHSDQHAAQVTPGRIVSVAPVASVSAGFLSGHKPGEDIIVRTFTQPRQMLAIVQPIKPSAAAFTPGETVGVATRNGASRVIALPGYTPGWPSTAFRGAAILK